MAYRDRRCNLSELPVSHVATCSPCFKRYMRYRRSAIVRKTLQLSAAAIVLLGVMFICIRVVKTGSDHTPVITENTIPPAGDIGAAARDVGGNSAGRHASRSCQILGNARR